ncbi:hypothetical protein Fot_06238 [Forsythia ovata]|uniref:Uncharacterized protein n=1 Tax=Forsythia ovata TaxID=205694 RepID=A0ABD1WSB7_9LAMI
MSGFYFSSVPKLKIRRGGIVDDIPHSFSVPSAESVSGVAIPQASEMSSVPFSVGSVLPSESFRQSGKRKAGADSRKEAFRTPVPPLSANTNTSTLGFIGTSWTLQF